ncbi:hypothetical protein K457DRAFT_267009 [Linnemannia elongata AG-77]|uniref:Uncharacterized protein n=1 Tax=Linnemannia elongata AG-77 TaxID=1314771 RepID=A0A197JCY0_9FUNG|nr:hypothetical protein K457DRAFT_267009 [Linnemannia elongata AG-77]
MYGPASNLFTSQQHNHPLNNTTILSDSESERPSLPLPADMPSFTSPRLASRTPNTGSNPRSPWTSVMPLFLSTLTESRLLHRRLDFGG